MNCKVKNVFFYYTQQSVLKKKNLIPFAFYFGNARECKIKQLI